MTVEREPEGLRAELNPFWEYTDMHITHVQETLSSAYLRAVASAALLNVVEGGIDSDGIDATVKSQLEYELVHSPEISVQLKSTSQNLTVKNNCFRYPLESSNYNKLVGVKFSHPRILVLLVHPVSPREWVCASNERLELMKCAYWACFKGRKSTSNSSSITVDIPVENALTPQAIRDIFTEYGNSGSLGPTRSPNGAE